jgi:cobalt/nickel transport system permease protein
MNATPVFNADGRPTRSGWIQPFDARVRVVAALTFALATVSLNAPVGLLAMLALAGLLAVAARLPAGPTLKRLAALDAFMAVVLITLPFSIPGDAIFLLGPLTASWQGLLKAVAIVLKANAVILAVLALAGTLDVIVLGHALAGLGLPRKLVHMLLLTVRYVGALRDQYAQLRTAMKVRGFRLRTSWHSWRSLGWLFGMVLVRSAERAERVLAAMKCRGYRGELHVISDLRMTASDWLAGGGFLAGLAAVTAWGHGL